MEEKLSVKIYNGIKGDIENGKIDFKDFFSEAQIAEKYQVSKAPVRDALHLLAKQYSVHDCHGIWFWIYCQFTSAMQAGCCHIWPVSW